MKRYFLMLLALAVISLGTASFLANPVHAGNTQVKLMPRTAAEKTESTTALNIKLMNNIVASKPTQTPAPAQPAAAPAFVSAFPTRPAILPVIDPSKPMVALTFDDGPSLYSPHILDLLEQNGGRATFFVVGSRVPNYEWHMQRAVSLGCEFGNHTRTHPDLTRLTWAQISEQLNYTADAIKKNIGTGPLLMRPPYGAINANEKAVCSSLGYPLITWSIDTLDWKHRNADYVYKKIMNNVSDGSIILCHDLYKSTSAAMDRVIPELVEKGYQLVTVSELLRYSEKPPVAGAVYNHR